MDIPRGQLYIGGPIDPVTGKRTGEPLFLEAHHLTTHGVIVGMTGSGKTGLGMVLLEEALLNAIPTLIIDPKGDMTNLALNFPDLEAHDFRPWVDPGAARREGVSEQALAETTAANWREGLASWAIDPQRMRTLKGVAEVDVYTPGSTAGIPLNVIGSLAAPELSWDRDAETLRDEIESFVSSLLVLADLEADPIAGREHVLLSTLIEKSWREGRDLDLAGLIGQVHTPPLRKLGVFDLDSFFPPAERMKLAMRLNGLVASPSFASWLRGPPLDIQAMLYTPEGRPRSAVVYLSHLSDKERQFIVTLLLSKMVTWIRKQPGTSDLRALVYMDEMFGFCPPSAEPPSKRPILTILKQARAHGVGMVLSTQNPVDLDYKAVSNTGTWMIGRLQTERDKARILEGLKSAAGDTDPAVFDTLIGGLGKRQFVLHSTRARQPTLFTTRWAMSYLRGPLTREEIATLHEDRPRSAPATSPARATSTALAANETRVAPPVAADIPVYYLDPAAPWAREVHAVAGATRYRAAVAARAQLTYDDARAGVDHREEWEAVFFPVSGQLKAEDAIHVDYDERDLRRTTPEDAIYVIPDAPLDQAAFFSKLAADLKDHLYHNRSVSVFTNPALKIYSRVAETRAEFQQRCEECADDRADEDAATLRQRHARKIERVHDKIAAAQRRVRELETDTQTRKQQEWVAGAGELLSMFLGGRRRARSLSGAASRRSQTRRTQERLRSAEEKLSDRQADLDQLEDQLADELEQINERWDTAAREIDSIEIGLEKSDIRISDVALLWVPSDPSP